MVFLLHAIPPTPFSDAFLGFLGFPPILQSRRLSPQDFDVVISNLSSNLDSLLDALVIPFANTSIWKQKQSRHSSLHQFVVPLPSLLNNHAGVVAAGESQFNLDAIESTASPAVAALSPSPSLSRKIKKSLTSSLHCSGAGQVSCCLQMILWWWQTLRESCAS